MMYNKCIVLKIVLHFHVLFWLFLIKYICSNMDLVDILLLLLLLLLLLIINYT